MLNPSGGNVHKGERVDHKTHGDDRISYFNAELDHFRVGILAWSRNRCQQTAYRYVENSLCLFARAYNFFSTIMVPFQLKPTRDSHHRRDTPV